MANKVSLSNEEKSIEYIRGWYEDQAEAIDDFKLKIISAFSNPSNIASINGKFHQLDLTEINKYFDNSRRELEHLVCLDLISAAEAKLRVDFYKKVYNKSKSKTAIAFREIYKLKHDKISLEEDILETWKTATISNKVFFSNFIGLLNYRHWLAHGRYWSKKLGQDYKFDVTYDIIEKMISKISN